MSCTPAFCSIVCHGPLTTNIYLISYPPQQTYRTVSTMGSFLRGLEQRSRGLPAEEEKCNVRHCLATDRHVRVALPPARLSHYDTLLPAQ